MRSPLRLSNFGAKSRVAALLRTAGDTQRQAKLLELTERARIQYTSLYVLQRTAEIVADAERRTTTIITRIQEGVSKGLFTEGDRHFFEGKRYRLQAQRTGLQASLAGLYAEQSRLLGTPCWLKAAAAAAFANLPTEEALLSKARANSLSEASRIELIAHLASKQHRLASLDAIPEFSPRIVYQHTNDGGDFIGAGIAIPLPIFNRNRVAIDRTSAELTASQQKRDMLANGGG